MPFQGQEVELLPWRLLSRGRGLQPASPCPLSAECPAWPSPAREGLRSPVSPHTLGMGAENAEEKGPWPSSPPIVAKATVQLAVDAREAGSRIPFAERARGWRTSREPARGRGQGAGLARQRFAGWRAPFSPPPLQCCHGDRQGTLTCTRCYSCCCLSKRNRYPSPLLPQQSLPGTLTQQLPLLASHKQETRADVQNSPRVPPPCLPLFSFPPRILYLSVLHNSRSGRMKKRLP